MSQQHRRIIELTTARSSGVVPAVVDPTTPPTATTATTTTLSKCPDSNNRMLLVQSPSTIAASPSSAGAAGSSGAIVDGGSSCNPSCAEDRHIAANEQTYVYLAAGAAAGIMEHCLMFPIDSVKTRMQSLRPHPQAEYRNIKHAICKMVKTEGKLRAYRGVNAVALGAAPAHALYFTSYENMKCWTGTLEGRVYGGEHISVVASAAVATFFHDAIMNPVEVIKQRIQVYKSPYKGIIQCARGVYATEGLRAFYRSFSTTLTMNLPFQCTHFVTYESMKKLLNPRRTYNWKSHLLAGGCAGGFAAALTSPFDVARTLLNTQEQCVVMQCTETTTAGGAVAMTTAAASKQTNSNNISGMVNAFRTIYAMHGVPGFFRGVHARVLFQIPATAISWCVYEFFKHSMSLQISEEEMMDLTL